MDSYDNHCICKQSFPNSRGLNQHQRYCEIFKTSQGDDPSIIPDALERYKEKKAAKKRKQSDAV
ncbi:hypothetical protein H0H93_007420, partial [Arthromyces matolae]